MWDPGKWHHSFYDSRSNSPLSFAGGKEKRRAVDTNRFDRDMFKRRPSGELCTVMLHPRCVMLCLVSPGRNRVVIKLL